MAKKLIKPSWYDEEFYNKNRTPEEWLYELWKRNQFRLGDIGLSHSTPSLSLHEQEKYFIEFIFDPRIENYLSYLEATPPRPIRDLSVSDIFIMHNLLTNADWYKNHPKRHAFESSISTIAEKRTLPKEQMRAFYEMYKTPWCVFYENHQQDSWCPKKENVYLSGIPISLDPGYLKEDTIAILKKKLNACVGKIQDIRSQFERWQSSKILAVFDLMLWFKIRRIEYSNIKLHNLIWPAGRISKLKGNEVNPYDDIDHIISLTNRVIDDGPIRSLMVLCQARKYKKEMSEG